MQHGVSWEEAMQVLDFAQLRKLPVEVKRVDEDGDRWTVSVGSKNAAPVTRHG